MEARQRIDLCFHPKNNSETHREVLLEKAEKKMCSGTAIIRPSRERAYPTQILFTHARGEL